VHEGADREREVVLVEAGEGVAEIDRQPCGQAGCEAEDPAFPGGARQGAGVEGGGGGGPVDCGVRSRVAGTVVLASGDVPGEVVAVEEGVVADEQFGGGLVGVDAARAGAQGPCERMLRCQAAFTGLRLCCPAGRGRRRRCG
jgi:hypothetical protein